ncbi:MAG: CAP domain-containing protein [Pontixanthobacter sp.]
MAPPVRKFGKIAMCLAVATMLPGMQGRLNNFEDRALAMHNRERLSLGNPALEWDETLQRGAQKWADHLSATGRFEHSPNLRGDPPQGENIWGGTPNSFPVESMVGLWIAEKKHYKPGRFPANSRTGKVADVSHYTQIIWQRTGKVGCARSDVGREEIMVCRYSRPGNIVGRSPM